MDALRLPPADADVSVLSGGERRRVALCRLLLQRAGPAAAGRAHQPPRRRVGGLAGAPPGRVQGHDRGRHPRPLLPRQRGRLDPRARPRRRHPLRGQLLQLAGAEAGTAGPGGTQREGPPAHDRRRARVGADQPQGQTHEVARRVWPATRSWWPRSATSSSRTSRSTSPPAPGWATACWPPTAVTKGYGDRLLIESLSFELPRAGIVGVIGANGAGKTHPLPHDHRTGGARRGHDRAGRHREARLRGPVARDAGPRQDGVGGDLRRRGPADARRTQGQLPPVHGRLQLQGRRPAETRRGPLRRRAQPRAPGEGAERRGQPAAAGRAHQRSRRGHPAGARAGAARRSPAARW